MNMKRPFGMEDVVSIKSMQEAIRVFFVSCGCGPGSGKSKAVSGLLTRTSIVLEQSIEEGCLMDRHRRSCRTTARSLLPPGAAGTRCLKLREARRIYRSGRLAALQKAWI